MLLTSLQCYFISYNCRGELFIFFKNKKLPEKHSRLIIKMCFTIVDIKTWTCRRNPTHTCNFYWHSLVRLARYRLRGRAGQARRVLVWFLYGSCMVLVCPGFGCSRISFHKKLRGQTQTSQPSRILDIMWHDARYLSRGAGHVRLVFCLGASWAWDDEKIALCVFFLSVLLLLSSCPFAVLLNCLYPNPQLFAF